MNEITLNSIDFDFEQLKADVTTAVQQYVDFKVTSGTVLDAKKARADLNKLSKQISDKRIELKNQYMKPINDFESKVKLIDAIIKEQADRLDRGVKEYEDLEKSARKLEIEMFYQTLNSPVDLIKIWSPSWLNATTTEKMWKTELTEAVNKVKETLSLIPLLNIDDQRLLTNLYLESLDLTKAQTTYAELVKDVSEQNIIIEEKKTDEPFISLVIEVFGTETQMTKLRQYMYQNGIAFTEALV